MPDQAAVTSANVHQPMPDKAVLSVSRRFAPATANATARRADQSPFGSAKNFLELAERHLNVALQPIVDVNSGAIFGCESLLRNQAALHVAGPQDVLDHAAALDVLAALDGILLGKALEQFATRSDFGQVLLFFNVDGRALLQPDQLIDGLCASVARSGRKPGDICIELSETNQSLSSPGFIRSINRFRDHGFKLAMDDFGTGYSGLRMLYEAKPDFLKIDRFFIEGINTDTRKRLFVRSFAAIAHALDMQIIAEGVETDVEHLYAREMGCDLIQGYFIARPTSDISQIATASPPVRLNADRRRQSKSADVIEHILNLKAIEVGAPLEHLFDILHQNPTQSVVPVVNARGVAVGAVFESDVKSIIYSDFGRDLVKNRCCAANLFNYTRVMTVLDIHTRPRQFLECDIGQIQDGVLVSEGGVYVGYLPPAAILKLTHAHQLAESRRQNPLSGLPANEAIGEFLQTYHDAVHTDRVFIHFDFDDFKPFNDAYGFRRGDRAIIIFSNILKRSCASKDLFIGHVGGDDFFAGASGKAVARLIELSAIVRDRFRRDVASLYKPEERLIGSICGIARDGMPARFPLMSCSAGIVEIRAGASVSSLERLSELLAVAKKRAKASPDRHCHIVIEPDARQ